MVNAFANRLSVVRQRFAATVEGKVAATYSDLLRGDAAGFETVEQAYRRIHGICGVAEAVGFIATGRAARKLDTILLMAHQAHRGFTTGEMALARKVLNELQVAVQIELNVARPHSRW